MTDKAKSAQGDGQRHPHKSVADMLQELPPALGSLDTAPVLAAGAFAGDIVVPPLKADLPLVNAAAARLAAGRAEARRIIDAMHMRGVCVELIGSMRTGAALPHSDIDLLLIDAGPLAIERAVDEIHALASGEIPIDVAVLQLVPERLRPRIVESLQHPDPLS